ncbi:expressed unknown protein [Seminavis robusta]|uniref:Uncharacterized protein n=1 Tax=Seminavis robusta TaxID=568900 RepID=A0A9N8DKA2_9STRA|nr:expressed unknown protein [Seminavis robusta]|eukprot:Sro168_g074660.1 n/a (180) ;mRNA; f:8290-8829
MRPNTFVSILLLLAACLWQGSNAQFGIPKKSEASVDAGGEVQLSKEVLEIATSLTKTDPSLQEQDAVDIATLIYSAKNDKDTKQMLQKMKADQPEAFAGTAGLAALEIIKGLEQAYEELKMLEYLFQDKERALRVMEEDGLIHKDKLPLYKKNPDLLEADTRKGLYFMFVALAEAAGYL